MIKKTKRIMIIFFILIAIILGAGTIVMNQAKFGKLPQGERLARIKESPNYKDGAFQNLSHTPELTEGYSMWKVAMNFFLQKKTDQKPTELIPHQKTNLHQLRPDENTVIWFGHSSYFIQVDGKKMLVDPVLSGHASPFSFSVKAFEGTDIYTYDDIPEIDYLFITHDHWDHLDYKTLKALKPKINTIICGLGVGSHLEYWGFEKENIIELDWNENTNLINGFDVHCKPARHFSGRGFKRNQTLWVSFAVITPNTQLFFGGDGGYDSHFEEIGKQFGKFDLVLLENGQYDKAWKYIHMHPDEVLQAAENLNAQQLIPVHSGKFDLANHAWYTPLKTISALHQDHPFKLITPIIGEKVLIGTHEKNYTQWWENEAVKKEVVLN